jgi:hypothetical protein
VGQHGRLDGRGQADDEDEGGAMPALPWKHFRAMEPDREYVAMVSQLPLLRMSSTPTMLRLTMGIRRQLEETPGVVGYSLDAKVLARRYYTLSVWESDAALRAFVQHSPHRETMSALAPKMGDTRFVTWTVRGSEPLPTWEAAKLRLV